MSLQGKTVLLTRPREQSAGLVEMLERRGATVEVIPAIEITPPSSWEACDDALRRLSSYDGLLLTSANGARAFIDRSRTQGVLLGGLRAITVGDATRKAAARFGLDAAGSYSGAAEMARALIASPVRGQRFLFPCGDIARDEMPEILHREGAMVDRIIVYRTVTPPPELLEPARTVLSRVPDAIVVFASPSAVRNLCGFLGVHRAELLGRALVAVVGPTTAGEVRRWDLTPAIIAPRPDAASLVTALNDYCP